LINDTNSILFYLNYTGACFSVLLS